MNKMTLSTFSNIRFDNVNPNLPDIKNVPVSSSEKQVREEVDRLNQSIEEIRKFREEITKRKPKEETPK